MPIGSRHAAVATHPKSTQPSPLMNHYTRNTPESASFMLKIPFFYTLLGLLGVLIGGIIAYATITGGNVQPPPLIAASLFALARPLPGLCRQHHRPRRRTGDHHHELLLQAAADRDSPNHPHQAKQPDGAIDALRSADGASGASGLSA